MGAAHVDALGTLACCAWVEDVALAHGGYTDCWASRILTTVTRLGLLQADWRQQPLPWVHGLRWQEVEVQRALARLLVARWQGSSHPDPRTAPSRGVALCTHMAWVLPLDPAREDLSRATAPPHTKVLGSFAVLRNYSQLRTGCAHLEVEQGRQGRRLERHRRLCRLCSGPDADPAARQAVLARTGTSDNVEDLKHFVLECPVYDALRARCPALPASLYFQLAAPDCMTRVFRHADQSCLARTLFKMKAHRAQLLHLPYPY